MSEYAENLRELVQANAGVVAPDIENENTVCTGVVTATEWVDGEGKHWFTWLSAAADGDELAAWRVRGFLAQVSAELDRNVYDDGVDDDA